MASDQELHIIQKMLSVQCYSIVEEFETLNCISAAVTNNNNFPRVCEGGGRVGRAREIAD